MSPQNMYPGEHAHMAMWHLEQMLATGDVAAGLAAIKAFPDKAIPHRAALAEPTREIRTRRLALEVHTAIRNLHRSMRNDGKAVP